MIWFNIALCLALLTYLAQPEISFDPFSVKFGALRLSIGVILTMIGIHLIASHYEKKAFKNGVEAVIKQLKE